MKSKSKNITMSEAWLIPENRNYAAVNGMGCVCTLRAVRCIWYASCILSSPLRVFIAILLYCWCLYASWLSCSLLSEIIESPIEVHPTASDDSGRRDGDWVMGLTPSVNVGMLHRRRSQRELPCALRSYCHLRRWTFSGDRRDGAGGVTCDCCERGWQVG